MFWRVFTLLIILSFVPLQGVISEKELKLPFEKDDEMVLTRGYNSPPTHSSKKPDALALDFTKNRCEGHGTKVLAVQSGTVSFIYIGSDLYGYGYGLNVKIVHEDGAISRYAHMSGYNPILTVDYQVQQGELVGYQGNTGNVSGDTCKQYPGTHLHFVMLKDGVPYKPEPMSGYTDFTAWNWYTSDNELYDTNAPEPEQATTPPPTTPNTPTSFFQKIKTFFSDFFSSDSGQAETEEENTIETENNETESDEDEAQEETPMHDVTFLPRTIPLGISEDQKEAKVIVFAKNIGNTTWKRQNTSLNVVGGIGPNQQYYHQSWKTQLRPGAMVETSVAPGEVASFAFTLTIPENIGNVFRLQLVHQAGVQFSQIGTSFVNISFVQEKIEEEIKEQTEDTIPEQTNDETFFEQLEEIKDVLGEKIGNVFESISDIIPEVFLYRGGDTSEQVEEAVEEQQEIVEEEEVLLPEISITYPTSTVVTTSLATTTIIGTLNEVVSYIAVNNTTTTADISSSTWNYDVALEANVTTTFSFVGWNASSTASSTAVSVSYIYIPEVVLPEISITSPTTSLYVTTSTPVVLSGTFNTTTSYLTLNSATSTAFSMNTSTHEWSIGLSNIPEYTTTTYSFIGWSEEGVSSTPVSIDVLYEPEVKAILSAPGITIPTASSTYTTSTIAFDIGGTAATGTEYVVLDVLGVTTSIPVMDNIWSTDVRYPGIGQYNATVYGIHEEGYTSATSSIAINIERELNYRGSGLVALSEIAWMGTEASANDEWFEIMFVPSEQGSFDDTDRYIVWGEYSSEHNSYEHQVLITDEIIISWNMGGPPIQIFDGPGMYVPIHVQFVFERTDQSTLSNANSIVYTGGLDNSGEHMFILTEDGVILDDVDMSSGWIAGDNETKDTMIRTNLFSQSWCTYSSCPESEYIGEQIITDADGNLVNGSPYSPYMFVVPQL